MVAGVIILIGTAFAGVIIMIHAHRVPITQITQITVRGIYRVDYAGYAD